MTGAALSVIQTDVSKVQSIVSPLQVVMDTEPGKAIRQTISAIVDGIPGLLKVLDDVAQIHPFIKSSYLPADRTPYLHADIQLSDSRRRRIPGRRRARPQAEGQRQEDIVDVRGDEGHDGRPRPVRPHC